MFSDLRTAARRVALLGVLATGAIAVALPAQAGKEALPGVVPVFIPPLDLPNGPVDEILNPTAAQAVANQITRAGQFCQSLPSAYQVDCMSERLGAIAASLPDEPGYAEIKSVLEDASEKLEAVAQSNRDASRPRINASVGGAAPVETTRPLSAVRPETELTASTQAAAILEEAGDLLLRSSAESQQFTEQYAVVAAALDSSALLLRS